MTSAPTTSSPARRSGSSIPCREPGEFGYETNPKEGYKYIGGANNWGEMSVDDERGIVYFVTGSATYDFYGADRHGANLFANCIIALDTRTGKRLWHFQTIHHDLWDLDNVSAPQLVTVRQNGRNDRRRRARGQDRLPLRLQSRDRRAALADRRAPGPEDRRARRVLGADAAVPDQAARPFVKQSFTVDDVNPWLLTPEQYETMRERVAKARNGTGPSGRIVHPAGRQTRDACRCRATRAARTGASTAANPAKGLVFVVGVNQVALLRARGREDARRIAGRSAGARGAAAGVRRLLLSGQAAFKQHCQTCHGADLRGALPGMPSLVGVTTGWTPTRFARSCRKGQGQMRPLLDIGSADLNADRRVSDGDQPVRRGGGPGPAGAADRRCRPDPSWRSGGAPQPPAPARGLGPFYPGIGGNAGNIPWPDGGRQDGPAAHALHERLQRDGHVHEAAVHDADRVRPQHRRHQMADRAGRPSADDCRAAARGAPAASGRATALS